MVADSCLKLTLVSTALSCRHGDCDSDMSDVNIVVHKDKDGHDRVFGSLHVGDDVCRLQPNADGQEESMECKPQWAFMEESHPHSGDEVDRRLGVTRDDAEAESSLTASRFGMKMADPNRRRLVDDNGSVIDVMVVWTIEAECRNSGLREACTPTESTEENIMGLIELAVEETNTAFARSGIPSELRLVHAYRHLEYIEPSVNTFDVAIDDLRNSGDGKLDDVHQKRELYGADLVSMILGGGESCGIAYIGPLKWNTFSATHYSCATGYYSFGHEIAHSTWFPVK